MISRAVRTPALLLATGLACFITASLASAQGGRKEFRTLNTDSHLITIQKNGQLDIALGDGTPVADDVFPMIWFDGKPAPERLKTSGPWTERTAVQDALGDGQGIHHRYKGCEWSLRAYPTRPYFVVQSGYTNEGKQPVVIKALFPFCVGEPSRGSMTLGEGTDAAILTGSTTGDPQIVHGRGESDDAIAALNKPTGRSLIAGFLTVDHARSKIEIAQSEADPKKKAVVFNHFRAGCYFDPPVTLAPGETLLSEALYISFAESDPVVGLQRYARGVQIANRRARPEDDTPLHAWLLPSGADPAQVDLSLARIRALDPLRRIGGVLVDDPRNPTTSAAGPAEWLSRAVRGAGLEPAAGSDPFSTNSPVDRLRADAAAARKSGDSSRLLATTPSLFSAALLDGAISAASEGRYLATQPSRQEVSFGSYALPRFRADVTAAGLMHCGLLLPVPAETDAAAFKTIIGRALPSPTGIARPVDLFTNIPPRVLSLAVRSIDGETFVVAVLNWNARTELRTRMEFQHIGLQRGAYYSVYDFWRDQYLGTARDQLDVSAAPEDATVLVLRPLLSHPMLAATGANLGQNWPALKKVDWDPGTWRLHVELNEAADTEAARRFTLAVPSPYKMIGVEAHATEKPTWESKGNSAAIVFPSQASLQLGFDAIFQPN